VRRVFRPGRYANVASTLALVVALGGTSYAAVALPKNSVGNKQLKTSAVTSSKVKDRTLLRRTSRPVSFPLARAAPREHPGPRETRERRARRGTKASRGLPA
jgi:hypothetical protein